MLSFVQETDDMAFLKSVHVSIGELRNITAGGKIQHARLFANRSLSVWRHFQFRVPARVEYSNFIAPAICLPPAQVHTTKALVEPSESCSWALKAATSEFA